ncbi:hypothetical protein F5X68DRAFT_243560 [Plectosphaerella plurivora]|uniref:Amidoligase enzyme n=1 Tax=Plectosphaerella plurivora TaxID=936078 RepID=A0A9P9AH36_9PEZI|nr:hypothetical protein F5X68DRAFT_243560 [Plectosphaerella plurivora]
MSFNPSDRDEPIKPTGECSSEESKGPEELTKRHVSFGCELEFLVACVKGDDPDSGLGLAPVVTFPRYFDSTAIAVDVMNRLIDCLAEAGLPTNDPRTSSQDESAQDNASATSVLAAMGTPYAGAFSVGSDCSVKELSRFGEYYWVPVEMRTPAAWNKPVYFDMVRLAVNLLTRNFRIRVNPSCGFHIHLGAGVGKHIDTRTMRRFGALWWASSPLLYTLHSPERRRASYALSMRDWAISLINKTVTDDTSVADDAWDETIQFHQQLTGDHARVFARDRFMGEAYDVEDDPAAHAFHSSKKFEEEVGNWVNWRSFRLAHDRRMTVPALGLPGRVLEDLDHMGGGKDARISDFEAPALTEATPIDPVKLRKAQCSADDAPPRPGAAPAIRTIPHIATRPHPKVDGLAAYMARGQDPATFGMYEPLAKRKDVMSGVREILSCPSSAMVAKILSRGKHSGLNLLPYEPCSFAYDPFDTKLTIEVRMGSASMDADWVVAWAGICTRLLEFCRDADEAEWLRVIRTLAWAQEEMIGEEEEEEEEKNDDEEKRQKKAAEKVKYDIVDLLVDIGAFDQVAAAEERLREIDVSDGTQGLRGWVECPTGPETIDPAVWDEDEPLPRQSPQPVENDWNLRPDSDSFEMVDELTETEEEERVAIDRKQEQRQAEAGRDGPAAGPSTVPSTDADSVWLIDLSDDAAWSKLATVSGPAELE